MEEIEKNIEIVTKTIISVISVGILAIIVIFFIGIARVNAKSYTWNSPYILDIQDVLNDTDEVKVRCRNTNTCEYNSSLWGGNYGMARYNVSTNINNEDNTIEANTYKLEFSAELWTVGDSTKPTLTSTSRLLFYTGTGTGMSRATCDGGESYNLNLTNEIGIYQFNYTCNEFLVNRNDISYFAIVFGSSSNLFYKVSILNNLKFIGPGEATNDDVINNQDKNTQNIINNQNQNTDKVIGAINGNGLNNDTKEPVNKENYENTHEKEKELLEEWKPTDEELENIDLEIEQDTANLMWNLLEKILNTNERIQYLVMSILVVGVIKLIMGR